MISFLVETEELLRLLWAKFIKKDTLDASHTSYALLKVDEVKLTLVFFQT